MLNTRLKYYHPAPYLNAAARLDPTRTTVLRGKFLKEMRSRFAELRKDVRISVVDNDALALKEKPRVLVPAKPRQFDFRTTAEKVEAFLEWIKRQEDLGVLEIIPVRKAFGSAKEESWTDSYIRDGYKKGIITARIKLKNAGIEVVTVDKIPGGVNVLLGNAIHADVVKTLYTRTYTDLVGITDAMDQQISRVLSEGLLQGLSPNQIATGLIGRVDKIGFTRAKALTRTEIVRAYNLSALNEYKAAGIEGVDVEAEWLTAEDACPVCKEIAESGPYSIEEAERLLMPHPDCRCSFSPTVH